MLLCRRFADVLADACARLGADVGRYSFISVEFHHILLAVSRRTHLRYGPLACSTARGRLCHDASIPPVTQQNRSSATRAIDNSLHGTFLHWRCAPSGRTLYGDTCIFPPFHLPRRNPRPAAPVK